MVRYMRKSKSESTIKTESGPMTGAPAVLRRLEANAAALEKRIDDATSRLDALLALGANGVDREAVALVQNDLSTAKDEYFKTAKTLLDYDKNVKAERREGEKVLVAEVQEWIQQLVLSLRLAVEQALLSSAQAAALSEEAEGFAGEVGPIVRESFETALGTASREGALPAWVR
jgi:hypothetical protein